MEAIIHYILHDIPAWFILLSVAVILLYWYLTKDFGMFEKYGITGPKPYPLLGTAWPMLTKGIMAYDMELYQQYKDKRICRTFEFGKPSVVITDPHLAKTILVKEFSHFVNHYDLGGNPPPLNRGLFSIRDDHWRHVRSHVSPTFTGARMKTMAPVVQKCAHSLVEVLEKKAAAKETVDAFKAFGSFTMDMIAATMFGMDVDSINNPDHPFVRHVKAIMAPEGIMSKINMFLFVVAPNVPGWLEKIGINMNITEHLDYFTNHLDTALKERKEDAEKFNDFLALMTESEVAEEEADKLSSDGHKWTTKGLTKSDILAQMMAMVFAGHDTTAITMVMTAYNLVLHDDVQRRLQEEIDDVLEGEAPNYENITKLSYMEMVLNEILRLYTPGFRGLREADTDIEIDGVMIPGGVAVWLPVYAYQRDPYIWPDPDTFDPERFSPEQKADRDPSLYMPFGMGPRNCVGMRLALLVVKIGLANILQKFTLVLDEECPREIILEKFRISPEKPLKLKFQRR